MISSNNRIIINSLHPPFAMSMTRGHAATKTESSLLRILVIGVLLIAVGLPGCVGVCLKRCKSINTELSCTHAGCTAIPVDEIQPDTQLVSLQSNYISSVPIIHVCSNIRSLNLAGNGISHLANGAFRKCANLRVLCLTGNAIRRITSELFMGLGRLQRLFLDKNELELIESNLFYRYLPSLETLDLSNNKITALDPNAVNDLRNLISLDLSGNKLTSIETIHFLGLEKLRELNLNGNEIENLTIANFVECGSLEMLDLSNNLVSLIPVQTFIGLTSLKVRDQNL